MKITNEDLAAFATQKVNLPAEIARQKREQVNTLRERLKKKIASEPGFSLVKMRHAGSIAKGTALRTFNDFDVAVYVRQSDAPVDDADLVPWMAERLREAYKGLIDPDQIQVGTRCVTITFKGTGTVVDVVPVLYDGEPNDFGYLMPKDGSKPHLTSVTLHLDFVQRRKNACPDHWAQSIRFIKWWAKQHKDADPANFKFKSFMAELIAAHLLDSGVRFDDQAAALEAFFDYVVRTELRERIFFTDYIPATEIPGRTAAPIEILDPVNADSNVADIYTDTHRKRVVLAAEEALDAITEAKFATTKAQAIECWQIVFGTSFRG